MSLPRFAVMGNPIEHSLSPQLHQQFAQQTARALVYERLLIDDSAFESQVLAFFKAGGRGLNITQPFKERAFQLSVEQTSRCKEAKSANTLWMKGTRLSADNTDGVGLLRDLQQRLTLADARVLLMGAGGAVRGILRPLLAATAKVTVTNRTREKAEGLRREIDGAIDVVDFDASVGGYNLIINATSARFSDTPADFPLIWLKGSPFCYDLAYHASGVTPFVTWARTGGCVAQDGFGMLVEQAAEAFCIWHGVRPDTRSEVTFKQKRLEQRQN